MKRETGFFRQLDWWTIAIYMVLVLIGWISIFASVYDPEHNRIIDTTQRYGMQMIWIFGAWFLAIAVLLIPSRTYLLFSGVFYILGILILLAVLVLGVERNGSQSWLVFGPVHFQPAEMAKVFVALALAGLMSRPQFRLRSLKGALEVTAIILIPAMLIVMEKETGLALVLSCFLLVLYREGLPGWVLVSGLLAIILFLLSIIWSTLAVLWLVFGICFAVFLLLAYKKIPVFLAAGLFIGLYFLTPYIFNLFSLDLYSYIKPYQWFLVLSAPFFLAGLIVAFKKRLQYLKMILLGFICAVAFTFSVGYIFNNILQPHHRARIENLLGIEKDIYGAGYNVYQSKIAIGSGGFIGKGFLQGTQTKYNFVPEQSTDFIFCTIGEEWGFVGATLVILLYLVLLFRIISIAERQRHSFGRIYGYGVAACFFFHVFINIGMTLGILPVIGIPLPFISYGGSSLWTFTLLLFILLKMDASRKN